MPSILLVVKHARQAQEDARNMARIELETSTSPETAEGKTAKGATAGGDARKARGVPLIGRGITGAINGTVPHLEVVLRDQRD